jgi:hypothetical protein
MRQRVLFAHVDELLSRDIGQLTEPGYFIKYG